MISENDYILSFYEPLSEMNGKEHITLVKNAATGQLYVKKTLSVYDRAVFEFIRRCKPQNVPRIIEILQEQDELIVIEEYLSGRSIREVLEERGPLPLQDTLEITEALLQILLPFHSADPPIVHRDIKPDNLLLSSDGVIKLVDFNAAKVYSPEKRRDTQLFGTVGYAAPEQYGFATSSPATDVYAVGMLITELSTGGLDPSAVPKPLQKLVKKSTHINPQERFPSAKEMYQALKKIPTESALYPFITRGPRSFLPPGFRSLVGWKILIAILGYNLIFLLTFAGGSSMNSIGGRIIEYLLVFIPSIGTVALEFNYRGLWQILPLLNSDKRLLRILGLIIYPLLLSMTVLLSLIILSGLLEIDLTSTPGP